MSLPLHGVIKGVGSDSPIEGLHRILWLNDKMDLLTTIEIPTWQPGQAAPRYYKGPEDRALSAYLLLEHEGRLSRVVWRSRIVLEGPAGGLASWGITRGIRLPMREHARRAP